MKLSIDTNIFPRKKGVYIVGGSIRDLIADRRPVDYDMAIDQDPEQFARSLAANTGGRVVEIGKHGHTVLRVVAPDVSFDILPLNGGSIEADLRRRDFTINAMALDLASSDLVDPLNGRQDMSDKWIRLVSPDIFRNDPVRLVRAYRMAGMFGFRLSKDTEAMIRRDAALIRQSPGERIREELFNIFQVDESHAQIERMASSGVLFSILPEIEPLKSCRADDLQPFFLEQALKAYAYLERLVNSRRLNLQPPADLLYKEMDPGRTAALKCAILLHDIARPGVRRVDAAGAVRFYGHAGKSAAMARSACERLRCSKKQTQAIDFIIRHHARPFGLFTASQKQADIRRGFIRFFMKCGDLTPDILLLALAESAGRFPASGATVTAFAAFVIECLNCYYATLRPRSKNPPPVAGRHLIKEFELKPSPLFKRILNAVEEEHLLVPNLTRDRALELVQRKLNQLRTHGTTETD
jgi:tRNA nucleotidyltransferase/poly(A) polymerase